MVEQGDGIAVEVVEVKSRVVMGVVDSGHILDVLSTGALGAGGYTSSDCRKLVAASAGWLGSCFLLQAVQAIFSAIFVET